MAARTPQEAVEAFLTPFKDVVGCITDEGFVARIKRQGGPYPATFQSGFAMLSRRSGQPPIQLTLTHTYYVWHPEGSGRATWPHLHAYGSHSSFSLERLHLPTGRVSIEAVVRFLIEDLDVIPRRDDWRAILDDRERQFWELRTWA